MSGLLFLTAEDFHVAAEAKGRVMCNAIPGFSLILFYSTQCDHCQSLIPIFKKLPGTVVSGCQFGILNVSTNRKCVAMSKGTLSEIQYVPYIVMYIDGRPIMKYAGPHDLNEISRFVVEVSKRVRTKQTFASNTSQGMKMSAHPVKDVPAYCYGKPLFGPPEDKICYLTNTTAYNSGVSNQKQGAGRQMLPSGAGMGH
jgi:thiol-disulfide isomerase/thioredoxin